MKLSQWDYEIVYRKVKENVIADTLLRHPINVGNINKPNKCEWYQRMLKQTRENQDKNPAYTIKNRRLLRHVLHTFDCNDNDPSEEWKLCIPSKYRPRVLRKCHDDPTAGHLGIAKTITRLSRHYYWPKMHRDATNYVRSCENCQRNKVQQQTAPGLMNATNVTDPW